MSNFTCLTLFHPFPQPSFFFDRSGIELCDVAISTAVRRTLHFAIFLVGKGYVMNFAMLANMMDLNKHIVESFHNIATPNFVGMNKYVGNCFFFFRLILYHTPFVLALADDVIFIAIGVYQIAIRVNAWVNFAVARQDNAV